jgi:hypothetical protein
MRGLPVYRKKIKNIKNKKGRNYGNNKVLYQKTHV